MAFITQIIEAPSASSQTSVYCFKNRNIYLDKYILQFRQMHFAIWTNTFSNLDKYNNNKLIKTKWPDWINTFCKLDKYKVAFITQIMAASSASSQTSNYCIKRKNSLDKYIWQFGQIHLAIWTNTLGNFDKNISRPINFTKRLL